jgi:hypothetical protein
MSTVQLLSQYSFNMGAGEVTLGFTADHQLYSKILFVKKTAPLESVTKVEIKKAFGSPLMQCSIKTGTTVKEKLFQMVHFDIADTQGKQFLEELKAKIPSHALWTDRHEENAADVKDSASTRVYPLQFWTGMTKSLAGMSRGVQIGVNYGTYCLLVIPIPLLIYVLASGCHRVTTTASGILVKRLGGKFYSWDEVLRIDVIKYHIMITQNGLHTGDAFLLQCTLVTRTGNSRPFYIRTLEGKQFVNEMVERKKMIPEMKDMFV